MDRMNPLDASFLYLENGITHMHVGSCAVFEGPAPGYDELIAAFLGKLPLVPRYRQRVRFVPFDLGRPVWVDDPHFNLEYHVRHSALPPPGSGSDLERLMGRVMSQELDRNRPLWEAWVVEGLEDGKWALISKVHHCMIDGIAGVDLITVMLDQDRVPTPPPIPDDWDPEAEPSSVRLVADAVTNLLTSPREQARAVRSMLRQPRDAVARTRVLLTGLRNFGGALRPTPPTTVDGTIGPHRRWTHARTTLHDVRTVREAFGGTVNDVVLTAITSGFRDLLISREEDPSELALRTLVPVSMRTADARGVYDNRVSAIFFDLPVDITDPIERLAAVRAEMSRLKDSHEPEAGEALTSLAGAFPAMTAQATRLAVRLMTQVPQRSMNTVTTNVPGPPMALYAGGRELLDYLPFVPLGPGVRVGVAVLSYHGRITFGVTGDFDTMPDLHVLATGIERAMGELVRLADDGSEEMMDLTEAEAAVR